jgi:hypothetical protein
MLFKVVLELFALLVIMDVYSGTSPYTPIWSSISRTDMEFLGMHFGKVRTEIYVVAYDTMNSKSVVSKLLSSGTLQWTYNVPLLYSEAPMLLNYKQAIDLLSKAYERYPSERIEGLKALSIDLAYHSYGIDIRK